MEEELKKFDFVQFAMPDIHGIPRGKLVPREMLAQACRDGVGIFSGTQYFGVNCELPTNMQAFNNFPNGIMHPLNKPGVVYPLEWSSGSGRKMGLVLCQLHLQGKVFQECPRFLAQRQVELLEHKGFRLKSAFEVEFNLMKKDEKDGGKLQPFGEDSSVIPYCNLDLMDRHTDFLTDMISTLRASGVRLEYVHSEYQAGQYEMSMQPQWGVESADDVFMLRYGVRSFGWRRGLQASFLCTPLRDHHTSGLHFNHSLWTLDGKNVLHDSSDPDQLSEIARHWIAGVLEHAPALMALKSPTLNCYRRMGVGFAPGLIYWNLDDRLCALRAKTAGGNVFLESRIPSSAANPYLVLAGTVAAGLDGVERKLACPKAGRPDPNSTTNTKMLPSTLEEALDALDKDRVLRKALGDSFVNYFLFMKREYEVKRFTADAAKAQGDDAAREELMAKHSDYYLPFI